MPDFEEKILIARTQSGDIEAFNPLIEKYQLLVSNSIQAEVKDTEIARDLCQNVWLKAFRAINTFRFESAFSSWLYRIAKNVCIDYHRKQKALFHIDPLHTINEHRIATVHPDPCDLLQQQELREYLHAAIATLTPLRKQVFLLYYIEELPIKAIATQLNKSEGTIKSHLRNARLQLQEHLTPYLKNQNTT
ncbi:hypothetical protein C6496_12905 [Candidatus Poribacteria bacterium]|nr:MAG: hypothetical protein C6496_12905 [Candidatus Poribacteria bacterium]